MRCWWFRYIDFVDWAYTSQCNQFDPEHRGSEEEQLREKLAARGFELVRLACHVGLSPPEVLLSSAGEVEGVEQVCSSLEPLKERPTYFIAFNHLDKLCLLVVCGTKSGSDALTNAQVPQLAHGAC